MNDIQRIYVDVLKYDKRVAVESLSWAWAGGGFKLYVCSPKIAVGHELSTWIWIAPANSEQRQIEDVYFLNPGMAAIHL